MKCEEVNIAINAISDSTPPEELVTAVESIISCIGNILEVSIGTICMAWGNKS